MNKTIISIKLVIFTIIDNRLNIFLLNNHLPSQGIEQGTSLDETVKQIFISAMGIVLQEQYTEQLYTISANGNINIVYYILVPEMDVKDNEPAWKPLANIPGEVLDYSIISYAVQRLQWKIEYTNVVYSLLPNEFTLSELQKTYEAILGKQLDKRNFRKKILSLHFLKPTEKKRSGSARPAQMYTFIKREPVMVNVF